MKAGRGVIHGEMPLKEHDKMHGFQLWINLNSKNKMSDPDYRDVPTEDIIHISTEDYVAHIIAGEWNIGGASLIGPLNKLEAESGYLDLELSAGGRFTHPIPDNHQVIVAVYDGELVADKPIKQGQLAVFSSKGELELKSELGAQVLVLHGLPHREPIANYGPFVMNTMEEIEQAIEDYQNGVLAV